MEGNPRTLLRKYCLEGSLLGLKYFYLYPDRVSRCYWTMTMVFCAGVACVLCSLLYSRFTEMPTRITIENQFEPVDDLPYPAITICSPNQITISGITKFKKNLVNGNLSIDIRHLIRQYLGFDVSLHLDMRGLEQLQDITEQNRYTILDLVGMLPQRCDDFIKRCILHQKLYRCADLFDPILTRSGMCCIFNGIYHFKDMKRNERKTNSVEHKLYNTGIVRGLSILTDYNPHDALDNSVMNAGASMVLITDRAEFPGHEKSSLIHPGIETFHEITYTYTYCSEEVQSLPVSSRNCYFENEFPLRHFKEYRNTDCDLSCFIYEVEKRCHCTLMFVPSVSSQIACNFTKIICIKEVKLQMSRLYESGQCACLRNCESRQYDSDVIVGNLDAIEHMIFNPYSDFVINKSTSIMHFYFPAFTYIKRKQETVMSLISLVSNLGGVFGLCLGCSFISFLEIWFYVYIAIKNRFRQFLIKKRRKRVGDNKDNCSKKKQLRKAWLTKNSK